jgi:hypothetical protein
MEPVIEQPSSMYDQMNTTMSDQDFKQKTGVYSSLIMELYRVLMGSFLILFVPQKCGDNLCGITEQIGSGVLLNDVAFGVNIFTFTLFICMYYTEVRRETTMIEYLHVNKELPSDAEAVGEALTRLSENKRQAILNWDHYYQYAGLAAGCGFIVNSGLSSAVIFDHYLDNKTLTVFITNLVFMALKLSETYTITNTKENIFLSAYLQNRVQYNDVDPDKILPEEDKILPEEDKTLPVEPSQM